MALAADDGEAGHFYGRVRRRGARRLRGRRTGNVGTDGTGLLVAHGEPDRHPAAVVKAEAWIQLIVAQIKNKRENSLTPLELRATLYQRERYPSLLSIK